MMEYVEDYRKKSLVKFLAEFGYFDFSKESLKPLLKNKKSSILLGMVEFLCKPLDTFCEEFLKKFLEKPLEEIVEEFLKQSMKVVEDFLK